MDISKWAFQNRNLIYFLVAVLLLGGAYSSYEMSKLEDPEIKVKLAMVVTPYPGASAHQHGPHRQCGKLLLQRPFTDTDRVDNNHPRR